MKVVLAWAIAISAIAGCDPDGAGSSPRERPEILTIEAPDPAIEGSLVLVAGRDFDQLARPASLVLDGAGGSVSLPEEESDEAGAIYFAVTGALLDGYGPGEHEMSATVRGGSVETLPYSFVLTLARDIPVALDDAPSGDVHRNDIVVLSGSGFLAEGEGTVTARFDGTFTPDGGGTTVPVATSIPVHPAERFARTRGVVRLTTAIGGIYPGTFSGSIELEQRILGTASTRSRSITTTLRFLGPELFAVDPAAASLEQYVAVRGAGFLGGPTEDDEATLLRVEGRFQPTGELERPFGPAELVLEWLSGSEVRGVMTSATRDGELVSELFGARRGTFRGTATVVVIKGTDELVGDPVPFMFMLAPVQQVVWLKFLPGFYDSLALFGLGSAAGVIEARVEERIESIYGDWLVDIRRLEPNDFSPNGYAITEIGGPDPNGVGLFGYDNTPGKDIGNLRLHDKIGGTNAETQADGNPGYGGVFVESFLYFSTHPGLPSSTGGGPEPDPLFDEIFDPVRNAPATLAEVRGEGSPDRVAVVERAVHALASIIGETSAHELGHSFGLADPYGSRTTYHNDVDDEGCLMDSGGSRPFGERADQPAFAPSGLCHDAPGYLTEILGR